MGILKHSDIFSSKYTTALISDVSNHLYAIPIKNVMGDFFIASIEKEIYCFKIEAHREKTYRNKGAKSCKVLFYDTNHYMPISPENNTLVENFLRENRLPRINRLTLSALTHLGNKESHKQEEFQPHNLEELFNVVAEDDKDYDVQKRNFQTLFKNLNVDSIVRPTKKVSEFLVDDLITTSPQFFGSVVQQYERTESKHRRVTNQPKTAKTNWLMIGMLLGVVGLLIGGVIYLNATGAFAHILPTLPTIGPNAPGSTGNGQLTMAQIGKDYPTPKSLVDAINAHTVSCSQLPDDAKHMVNDPTGGGAKGTCP